MRPILKFACHQFEVIFAEERISHGPIRGRGIHMHSSKHQEKLSLEENVISATRSNFVWMCVARDVYIKRFVTANLLDSLSAESNPTAATVL
jgi:hypothetical protein